MRSPAERRRRSSPLLKKEARGGGAEGDCPANARCRRWLPGLRPGRAGGEAETTCPPRTAGAVLGAAAGGAVGEGIEAPGEHGSDGRSEPEPFPLSRAASTPPWQ